MSQEQKKSLTLPVAVAEAMPGTNGGFTMAVFPADQVPVGCELYVQPKGSRLRLEVEVANENALHWKDGLQKANERNSNLRKRLAIAEALLGRVNKVMSHELIVYRPALISTATTLLGEVRAFIKE